MKRYWLEVIAAGDAKESQIWPLEHGVITIGRGSGNTISLEGEGVSRSHVQVTWKQGLHEISHAAKPASKNGFSVNGIPYMKCPLRNGDRIRLGKKRTLIYHTGAQGNLPLHKHPLKTPPTFSDATTDTIEPAPHDQTLLAEGASAAIRLAIELLGSGNRIKKQDIAAALQHLVRSPKVSCAIVLLSDGTELSAGTPRRPLRGQSPRELLNNVAATQKKQWITAGRTRDCRPADGSTSAFAIGAGKGNALFLEAQGPLDELTIATASFLATALERLVITRRPVQGEPVQRHLSLAGISTASSAIAHAVHQAALTSSPIIITGPAGTGKTHLAHAIHHERNPSSPINILSCDTSDATQFGRNLFGTHDTAGALERCAGGTIILDEILLLPRQFQALLDRILSDQEIITFDGTPRPRGTGLARVIALSEHPLENAISAGIFHPELAAHFHTQIPIPPLAERREDIEALAGRFLEALAPEFRDPYPKSLIEALEKRPWPGNIRELRNTLSKIITQARQRKASRLTAKDLPALAPVTNSTQAPYLDPGPTATIEQITTWHTQRVLALCDGNKTQAATLLGKTRSWVAAHLD